MSTTTSSNGTARRAALDEWQARQAEGVELTGAELAQRYGKSPSWGRSVAREARHAAASSGVTDVTPPAATAAGVPFGTPDHALPIGNLSQVSSSRTPGLPHRAEEVHDEPAIEPNQVSQTGTPAAPTAPTWVAAATRLAVLAVAAAAGLASVEHLADLSALAGTGGWRVWLLPASVDGLATAAALVLYSAHRSRQTAGVLPWAVLVLAVAASVAGNITSVYPELVEPGALKIAVGATPPLSLALAVHLLFR